MGGCCAEEPPENKFLSDGHKNPEKNKPEEEEEIFDFDQITNTVVKESPGE
jgi:hypothetical protein